MKHSKIFTPTRSIAMLMLAGAMTLPLQGCNEDLLPADAIAEETATPKIDDLEGHEREHTIIGGLLYDEWAVEVEGTAAGKLAAPATVNPLMTLAADPALFSASSSWRCKSCHGWDYKGVDGRYGMSSSNYTGFPGVLDSSDQSIEELVEFLTNGRYFPAPVNAVAHAFDAYMTTEEIESLAYFIKYGTLDTDEYIGKYTKDTYGDGANGEALYAGTGDCVSCHDADGKALDFGGGEYVGTIGVDNPWEMLHKIRFGQPDSSPTMPSGYDSGLSTQDAVDIMTHTQTLPES